ncbi:MAG: methyltransferase domain-containing protein [Bryobacteraceae bacterium]|jgi:glycosyltransferase involved in cell wall biosynthesis/SAM-dependent methyltransferase
MRVAFFSPLPPCRSGIADYSETLVEHLKPLVDLEVFADADRPFDPSRFDIALYHLGNNPHHGFVYEAALRHPGVVVMHESNLHHLIADLTIRRNDWDAYLRACEYEGGPDALAYARRVRALEVGPDYDGVRMLRRVLESARAVVVHSQFMVDEMHAAGFDGPIARIPHGAWIPEADRNAWRYRLGLDETTPLIGVFGFLKPYKRIAESLRAFRRLLRVVPAAKMILVGEPHPEFPLQSLIHTLGLSAAVRVMGFTPIQDFTGYMAACDIVLNLRYPTVGESSGSLLRAFGLGKAVLVSGVGAFQELPDDVCLKVPVGAGEEDLIFEYLNLLASRPDVARALGERAARYVKEECNWDRVAGLYASFLRSVVEGKEWKTEVRRQKSEDRRQKTEVRSQKTEPIAPAYVASWAANTEALGYVDTHLTRLVKTLEITPPGSAEDRILEMGAYLQITPALRSKLGYGCVRGCYYGPAGKIDRRSATSTEGESFDCEIDLFNAEKDPFPYPDGHFATVLCCELIEHLTEDPMHLMSEINRIVKPGGHLVLTTPNIGSLRGIAAILEGYHPGVFTAYIRPRADGEVEARHNREYAPKEIERLLLNSGFTVTRLETGPFRQTPRPEEGWVLNLLERFDLPKDLRGDDIYAVGRKTGAVRERYPDWLYA